MWFDERRGVRVRSELWPTFLALGSAATILIGCGAGSTEAWASGKRPAAIEIAGKYALTASSEVVHDPIDGLQYSLILTNLSETTMTVSYGGCWAYLQLYSSADVSQTPSYDQSVTNTGCTLTYTRLVIPPGGTSSLSRVYPVASLISDGVRPGHYSVAIRVAPNDSLLRVPAGQVEIQP